LFRRGVRDRVGPLLLDFNAQVLAQALDADLTTRARAAEDGALVAANPSRHKLVNQAVAAAAPPFSVPGHRRPLTRPEGRSHLLRNRETI
jgi:hypothetical protein